MLSCPCSCDPFYSEAPECWRHRGREDDQRLLVHSCASPARQVEKKAVMLLYYSNLVFLDYDLKVIVRDNPSTNDLEEEMEKL